MPDTPELQVLVVALENGDLVLCGPMPVSRAAETPGEIVVTLTKNRHDTLTEDEQRCIAQCVKNASCPFRYDQRFIDVADVMVFGLTEGNTLFANGRWRP